MVRQVLRGVVIVLIVVVVLVIGGGIYARSQVRASLAILDGTATIPSLSADVRVVRDALGIPTITGSTREDVARALGFLHAQDRFFQMDLQRRQPAGELAALVGPRAIEVDQQMRVHRFRNVAHRALERVEPSYRKLLDAYADGVNAGLNALGAPPFEYLVLRATPEPWHAEDSILTVLAMFNTLQGRQALFEQSHGALRDTLPGPMFRFLSTAGSEWDTPVVGNPIPRPPIPGPDVFDLRHIRATEASRSEISDLRSQISRLRASVPPWLVRDQEAEPIIGSNNWAVDGSHGATGAIVANDMHLSIGVPIIWYRASMVFPDAIVPSTNERLSGVTLPGIPGLVVGSNGHVAWGFTNSGGDWSDLVRIEADPRDPKRYLTPDGPKPFDVFEETIAARGWPSKTVTIRWTIWGPIVWKDARGREYAQRWVAHDANALASDVTRPERARSVEDLLVAVAGLGIPNQNVTVADTKGQIGWTIGGTMPKRVGHDGMTPESWADGTHRWDGYLAAAEFPRILNPAGGRIWSANAPVVDGAMLSTIGEGGYADGIRARIIRDRLMRIDKATPQDMLAVQLEDRALFLERWRKVLLDTLSAPGSRFPAPAAAPREEFRRLIDKGWTGRASPGSVGYRLVKEFRLLFVRRVMTWLTAPALDVDPAFDYTRLLRSEGPVWQLLVERPMHLLDPEYRTWDEAIVDTVDRVIAQLTEGGRSLADRTWGEANSAEIRHPLAGAIPFFGRHLNMPGDPLPGDVYTPRASTPRTGPSERMAVSPGRESEGILHVSTGQSGHPLSPHYRDQYRAWLLGEATPFLPGSTVNTLVLTPRQ